MNERQQQIQALLRTPRVCACGRTHPVSLRALVMEPDGLSRLPEVLNALGTHARIAMICDDNTYRAAGARVEALIHPTVTVRLDPVNLHASDPVIDRVRALLPTSPAPDLLIAVGSGTIHDITRFMATEQGIDFVSVPTAASVDGYLSSVAAMTWHGVKRSFPAKAPVALVADSTVIAAAPYALTASGVGDLIGKYTALFDWRAAHIVTGEYLCETVIGMEEDAIRAVEGKLDAVRRKNPAAVEDVMFGLVLSGLAMQMVGNSRPASGSEHHISHLIEMDVLTKDNQALHGEKVGVATALVCDRVHRILAKAPTTDRPADYAGLPLPALQAVFGDRTEEVLANENTPDPLADIAPQTLLAHWQALRALANATLPTGDTVRALLTRCGAKVTLDDIGIDPALADSLCRHAPYVRRRLTFLRLAKLVGMN